MYIKIVPTWFSFPADVFQLDEKEPSGRNLLLFCWFSSAFEEIAMILLRYTATLWALILCMCMLKNIKSPRWSSSKLLDMSKPDGYHRGQILLYFIDPIQILSGALSRRICHWQPSAHLPFALQQTTSASGSGYCSPLLLCLPLCLLHEVR